VQLFLFQNWEVGNTLALFVISSCAFERQHWKILDLGFFVAININSG
jgi:hypothetical protein